MKKFILILTVALAVFVFASCASTTYQYNIAVSGATIQAHGEATNTVWLGIFGESDYPEFYKVAMDNGITKIATVERYRKVGVFGLWVEYTTIVTGEGGGPAPAAPADQD